MLRGLLRWSILHTTPQWTDGAPHKGGALHSYPQASGAGEKSFPEVEPEARPLIASLPLGRKMNFHTNLWASLHNQALEWTLPVSPGSSAMDGRQACGMGVGHGGGLQNLWIRAQNLIGEFTKWVLTRQPFLLFQGIDRGSGKTLMVAPGKIKRAEQ